MKAIFLIISILVLITACEKDTDYPIPEKAPVLVVNSLFNPDSIWAVAISQTIPIKTADTATIKPLEANVSIQDSAGNLIENLTYNGGSYISPSGKRPRECKYYRINVQAKNFEAAYALGYIPDSVKITDVKLSRGKSLDKRYNVQADYILYDATLKDNGKTKDFYMIELIMAQQYGDRIKMEIEGNDNIFEAFSSTVALRRRVFFTDETFNGQVKQLKLKTLADNLNFPGDIEWMPNYYLRLYSLSEDLYKYLVSYHRQAGSTEFEYTNQPIRVNNNIKNGLGIFGGYTHKDYLIDKQTLYNLISSYSVTE